MDCIVHGVAKSGTGLSNFHFHSNGITTSHTAKTLISVIYCCIITHSKIQWLTSTILLFLVLVLTELICMTFSLNSIGFGYVMCGLNCDQEPRWLVYMVGIWCWLQFIWDFQLNINRFLTQVAWAFAQHGGWIPILRVKNPRGSK